MAAVASATAGWFWSALCCIPARVSCSAVRALNKSAASPPFSSWNNGPMARAMPCTTSITPGGTLLSCCSAASEAARRSRARAAVVAMGVLLIDGVVLARSAR